MKKPGEADESIGCFFTILFVIAAGILWIVSSAFEAHAFNACTGGHASIMTAMFTELRVTECKK